MVRKALADAYPGKADMQMLPNARYGATHRPLLAAMLAFMCAIAAGITLGLLAFFIGFMFGVLRVLFIAPTAGAFVATGIELTLFLPILFWLSGVVCDLLRRLRRAGK